MKSQRIDLAIALIAYGGQVTSNQALMWLTLGSSLQDRRRFRLIQSNTWDINPVDRARNVALASAMAADADWLLMLDADVFAQRGLSGQSGGWALLNMIDDADAAGFDVVAAPVVRRLNAPLPMVYRLRVADNWLLPIENIDLETEPRGLVPIDAAATAIMAINLHAVGEASFRFVEAGPNQQGLSEDLEFCRQMKAQGRKIACDTRIVTGHMARPICLMNQQGD
jgi:hypothetical protein